METTVQVVSLLFTVFGLVNGQGTVPIEGKRSGGIGCAGLAASFLNQPIPNTNLYTGTFYQISTHGSPRGTGYVSWASRTDKFGKNLGFIDYNNSHGFYRASGKWFLDTYWAFLATNVFGWYRMVNCGLPYKYLAVSRDENIHSNSTSGIEGALVIDEIYPGRHSKDDFLFKPIYLPGRQAYQIYTKAFGVAFISDSNTFYSGDRRSFFMKVDKSNQLFFPGQLSCQMSLFSISQPLEISLETQEGDDKIDPSACS